MPLQVGELYAAIDVDQDKFNKGLKSAENSFKGLANKLDGISTKMKKIGTGMTMGITLPVLGAAAASFKMASDYQESLNKVDVAFKDSSGAVKEWSKTTLNEFGIAKGTALDMAAKYGDMASGMGLNTTEAAKMSTSLVGLAGDLASFKNISIDIADTALTAIFTGETESLKQLGIVMTQANLEEFALSKGIKGKIKDMNQAEQVQLRYAYVVAKSGNSVGDFSRTQDGAANQMRIFQESMKELGASFGENLLPVITPFIKSLNEMLKKFGELSPATKKVITVVALLAAALGPLLVVLGSLASIIPLVTASTGAMGIAFTAALWPIAAIGAGIYVAYKAFRYLWDSSPKFKAWAKEVGSSISIHLTGKINVAIDAINLLIKGMNAVTNWDVPEIKYVGKAKAVNTTSNEDMHRTAAKSIGGGNQPKYYAGLKGFASGTNYAPGGLSWVGERGPELVNLPRGSQVLSNSKSMEAMNNQTVRHTGTVRVEGVNNRQELVAVVEKVFNQSFAQGNRRIPQRVAMLPSRA